MVKVEQTTVRFVATDGREFANKDECLQYEKTISEQDKNIKTWESLPKTFLESGLLEMFVGDEHYFYKVTVESEGQVNAIIEYHKYLNNWVSFEDFSIPTNYPCTMVVCGIYDCIFNIFDIDYFFQDSLNLCINLKK